MPFTGSSTGWREYFSECVASDTHRDVLDVNIFFDFRPLAGNFALAEELDAAGVLARNPAVRPDDVVGGVFCATDGFLRPMQLLDGYAATSVRAFDQFPLTWLVECVALLVPGGLPVVAL